MKVRVLTVYTPNWRLVVYVKSFVPFIFQTRSGFTACDSVTSTGTSVLLVVLGLTALSDSIYMQVYIEPSPRERFSGLSADLLI